jgi:hypothetical protein
LAAAAEVLLTVLVIVLDQAEVVAVLAEHQVLLGLVLLELLDKEIMAVMLQIM